MTAPGEVCIISDFSAKIDILVWCGPGNIATRKAQAIANHSLQGTNYKQNSISDMGRVATLKSYGD